MAEALPDPLSASLETRWTRSRIAGAGFFLICVTVLAYLPALRGGFVWDDAPFLLQNKLIKAGDGLYRLWFTTAPDDYWPVTYSTLWLEWRLWGTNALGYHVTNLVLHLGEALLLWGILRRLRMPGSYLAALLFAVHPVNVESVAWIAQLKNQLAMLFYLASIGCFLKTKVFCDAEESRIKVGTGGPPVRSRLLRPTELADGRAARPYRSEGRWYALSLLAFTLAMLSKGSVAMLPVVLLGLLAWCRRLTVKDLVRLSPFFLIAGVLALTDIWFQKHGISEAFRDAGFWERLLGAAAVVGFYLGKALVPLNLIFIYPQWHIRVADPLWWAPLLGAIALTVWLWRSRQLFARPALFAWIYFCLMLFPVMGFTDVYFMKYSLVADHYQHLAIIGVLSLVGAGWAACPRPSRFWRTGLAIAAGAAVSLLALLTWRQCEVYRDNETLYRAILRKNPECWVAQTNLGYILTTSGRSPEAIGHFEQALRLDPYAPEEIHNDLGIALFNEGRLPEAIAQFEEALRINAGYPEALVNLGDTYLRLKQLPKAEAQFEAAAQMDPDNAATHDGLGVVLVQLGRLPEAIGQFGEALRLDPGLAQAHDDWGDALADSGRNEEAAAQYEAALRLNPRDVRIHGSLGAILLQLGRVEEAVDQFAAAARLQPDNAEIHNILGSALAQLGRTAEARRQFEEALRLKPGDAEASSSLARLRELPQSSN